MTPNEQGAFCGKCVKTVIDFTEKSLDEIKSFFAGHEQEKICGRFQENQLTGLSFDAFFEKFRRFEFTKRFAVIIFFTFGMWLFGAPSALAQSNTPVKGDVMVQEPVLNVKCNKDSVSKPQQLPQRPIMGAATPVAYPQAYKMGKVAPVKQEPVKQTLPEKSPDRNKPVKPAVVKKPIKKN